MSDNVVKFRRIEKKPEPPVKKPRGPLPGWVPFAVLVAVAVAIYLAQQRRAARRLSAFAGIVNGGAACVMHWRDRRVNNSRCVDA